MKCSSKLKREGRLLQYKSSIVNCSYFMHPLLARFSTKKINVPPKLCFWNWQFWTIFFIVHGSWWYLVYMMYSTSRCKCNVNWVELLYNIAKSGHNLSNFCEVGYVLFLKHFLQGTTKPYCLENYCEVMWFY